MLSHCFHTREQIGHTMPAVARSRRKNEKTMPTEIPAEIFHQHSLAGKNAEYCRQLNLRKFYAMPVCLSSEGAWFCLYLVGQQLRNPGCRRKCVSISTANSRFRQVVRIIALCSDSIPRFTRHFAGQTTTVTGVRSRIFTLLASDLHTFLRPPVYRPAAHAIGAGLKPNCLAFHCH